MRRKRRHGGEMIGLERMPRAEQETVQHGERNEASSHALEPPAGSASAAGLA